MLPLFRRDERARRERVVFEDVALFAHDFHVGGFVEDYAYIDFVAVGVNLRERNARDVFVMDCAVVAGSKFGGFDRLRDAADVEGSHRQLSAGFAD